MASKIAEAAARKIPGNYERAIREGMVERLREEAAHPGTTVRWLDVARHAFSALAAEIEEEEVSDGDA